MKIRRDEILACLPSTKAEARTKTGLNHKTVLKWFKILHEDEHTIYIVRWKPHPCKGPAMAVYAIGDKPDAPCDLPKLTRDQVNKRYKLRCERDGRADLKRAKDRNKYWKKKAASKKNTWADALGIRQADVKRNEKTKKRRRIKALRRLIEELRKGELGREVAATFPDVSHGGVHACFLALVRGGVAEISRREYVGGRRLSQPIYRLVADSDQIERFLAGLGCPEQKLEDKAIRKTTKIMSEHDRIIPMNSGKEIAPQTWFSGLFYAA